MSESKEALKKGFPQTLEACGGIISSACAVTGIARETYRRWIMSDPDFKAECEAARDQGIEYRLDRAEAALNKNIDDGKESSIFYILNNLGQSRGYGKRPDAPSIDVHKIDLSTLSTEQLMFLIDKFKDNQ